MKLIPVNYFGFTAIDKRFSSPMLPWIVAEIRKRTSIDKLSLGVENGHLQAYDKDFELQFAHRISNMTRFSQADFDPSIFLYLLRDDIEQLLYCYLFQTTKVSDVTDLYQQMKEQNVINPAKSISSSSAYNLTSLCGDISPSSSNFFEVLYIGKIKVWHKKVPDTFVDNALVKFRLHDLEKRDAKRLQRLKSEATIVRRGSLDSACDKSLANVPPLIRSASTLSSASLKTDGSEVDLRVPKAIDVDDIDRINEENEDETNGNSGNNDDNQRVEDAKAEPLQKSRSDTTINDSNNNDEHNRTMVLQVGRNDLRLISPDRKIVLLHKRHRDVSTCVQGMNNAEHFSFISREGNNVGTFIGYVFKCESKSVAAEAVSAITQAFANSDSRSLRPTLTSCEHCPMVWFHKLCVDVENLSDRKTQATILHRIETLDDEERNVIMTKYRGAETDSLREQNEFLMMLLRAHCEMKQAKHAHDTAENRSEFLNQYLGGGNTIFMKAKRSLSISFDHLLKRRGSKDDVNLAAISQMALPLAGNKDAASDRESDGFRSRSSTIGSQNDLKSYQHQMSERRAIEKNPKSPMMDIFLRIGNSPKTSSSDFDDCSPRQDAGSWRQAIFKRVVTPNKLQETDAPQEKRTTDELRQLWKKSIRQAILLIRMEKENAKLRARQEESAVKRIKLEYDEIRHHGRESLELWETLTAKNNCDENKSKLHDAIKRGVPRVRRGDVWQLLADDFNANFAATTDLSKYPNYHVSYENLLKQLTSHQHAILIDLGRTFPSHTYFSSPLGPGQLALFNLLKAYSLLDPEVGYCQGLSFVAGVLLLHMSESQAFSMLKHLMFCRGLRLQYLPDMIGLQIKFYQLSRLLHDQLPDLYEHLNFYDVTPTLYAAPWLLTLFASQFPLGFVTHVFDLLFMDDPNVVFKVALALLSYHRDVLLKCENFEEIMNYLKNTMTAINSQTLELTMKHVNSMDINKQLNVYLGEYQVLQEDVQSAQTKDDIINRLENEKRSLVMQNKHLEDQVQKLEKLRATQQGTIDKLEVHSRGMDVTLSTLALFVNDLMESDTSLEIPGEVQRILSEYSFHGRNGREEKPKDLTNRFKKPINPDKLMVKSLSTGLITLNNDAAMRTYSLNANYKEAHHNNNNFFSSSHLNILSEKTHNVGKSNGEEKGLRGEAAKNKSMLMENSLPLRERADVATKSSPTLSIDSGIVTPSSPKDSHNSHPLSNCDIEFIYSGTRELKNIRQLKSSSKGAHADS